MTSDIHARFQLDFDGFGLDVDLSLPGSGITVVFGESGSGKTTLLRCVAGLQKVRQGFLSVNGTVWQDSTSQHFLPAYRRPLGYVFQEANLFPHLSVQQNLQYGRKRSGKPASADLGGILELLGISHLTERMPANLSGGERQRVAIARALALDPQILLMDEPLAALDFKRKQEILPYLDRLHRQLNIPMLYVTHSLQELAQLADHVVLMNDGQCISSGTLQTTLGRLDLPLAGSRDAASVWPVTVIAHEPDHVLTRVDCSGLPFYLPFMDVPLNTPLRLQIHARDVSIALEAPRASSILNILQAKITDIIDHNGQVVVSLQVGSHSLLAHITRKSARLLALKPGDAVYVQIKESSLLN